MHSVLSCGELAQSLIHGTIESMEMFRAILANRAIQGKADRRSIGAEIQTHCRVSTPVEA
jgi:hypothetical protein